MKRFERFQKMAKEEFGLTVTHSDKQETFKDIFDVEADCDGRCLNCDYYEPTTNECRRKEKRCKGYCGVACVDGHCPIALYNEDFTMFETKPSCDDCLYYKGCEDCYFRETDMCVRSAEKGGE